MELELKRHDLAQLQSVARHCMRVAPTGKKATQKIAVGDSTGVVYVFSVKKGQVVSSYRGVPTSTAVSCLTFGKGKDGESTGNIFFSQVRRSLARSLAAADVTPSPVWAAAPLEASGAGL